MSRFARVIPLCRTPVGIDAFDYLIPDGASFAPGDLVRIPLRARTVEGVVLAILPSSPFASKARHLTSSMPITRFGQDWIDLLEWLSARTFQSTASVAKAWLRLLPKKLEPWTTMLPNRKDAGRLHTEWCTSPELTIPNHVSSNGRTLIVTPLTQQAERIAQRLGCPTLLSDDPKTVATDTWRHFLEHPHSILVTTRIGVWLGLFTEQLILLEPENDEHKQDELSPRFDARLVAAWLHQRKGIALTVLGRTPPIHVDHPAPSIDLRPQLCIRHTQGRSSVPGLSFDALERVLTQRNEEPLVVIHPIRGLRARCQCRTCGLVLACERCGSALRRQETVGWCDICHQRQAIPDECPRCGGFDFSGSPPGIDLLKREWAKHDYPTCEWRDGSVLALDAPLPPKATVLVTEPHLLGGYAEDIRRTERLCRAYRLLASHVQGVDGELILQVHEGDTERWITWLNADGVRALTIAERSARAIFRYPPSIRLVKLLIDGSEAYAQGVVDRMKTAFVKTTPLLEWRGPFLAEGRPRARTRWVIHALFPPETSEQTLVSLFKPWARLAKIDLDAVAFLR